MTQLLTRDKEPAHTTSHEMQFAMHIGEFSEYDFSPLELLKRYKKACLKRDNWGDVDKWVVMAFIDERIVSLSAADWNPKLS